MKVVNTSKSIYNTVLMIVTINTNKYSLYTKISPKIKLNHHRNQNSKYSIFKLFLDQRIRYTSHFFIFFQTTFLTLLPPSFLSLCLVHHSQFQYHRSTKTNGKKQTYLDLHKLPITFHNRSPSTTYDNTPIPIILFTASATDPASFLARLFPSTTARAKLSIGFVPASQLVLGITRNERMRRGEEEEKKIPRDVACTRESSCPTL